MRNDISRSTCASVAWSSCVCVWSHEVRFEEILRKRRKIFWHLVHCKCWSELFCAEVTVISCGSVCTVASSWSSLSSLEAAESGLVGDINAASGEWVWQEVADTSVGTGSAGCVGHTRSICDVQIFLVSGKAAGSADRDAKGEELGIAIWSVGSETLALVPAAVSVVVVVLAH